MHEALVIILLLPPDTVHVNLWAPRSAEGAGVTVILKIESSTMSCESIGNVDVSITVTWSG